MKRLSMLIAFVLMGLGCGQSKPAAPAANQAPAKQETPKAQAPAAAAPAAQAGKTDTTAKPAAAANEQEPATAADFEQQADEDITPDNLDKQVSQLEGELEK